MGEKIETTAKILPSGIRYTMAAAIILLSTLLLVAALSIPFLFESPSMWYKFGIAKTSLRTGKMIGLAAGVLILLQLPQAGRFKFLDRIFSMPGLIREHRIHAWIIAAMALAHPFLVLYSEGKWWIPLELRYWPEWLGVGLVVMILLLLVASQGRRKLGIPFHVWIRLHRMGGLLIAALLVVHVLYVSESFTDNIIARMAVIVAAAIFCILWLWVRSGWMRARRRPYEVAKVEACGEDSTRLTLRPLSEKPFTYIPGQFAIVSFRSARVSSEPHPFTLSSSPTQGANLQFTIRACGDWTRTVSRLQPGDKALIQGPFGRFGHRFSAPDRELILIAGGIGITPMLSMLRYMADKGDTRSITLIWSNRTKRHMDFPDEMDALSGKLTGLRLIPIFTRSMNRDPGSGRLNRTRLQTIFTENNYQAVVFVCGPPAMIKQVTTDLKALGFPSRSIHSEFFGY